MRILAYPIFSLLAFLVIDLLGACNRNGDYCPGAPLDDCRLIDAAGTCSASSQCGSTPATPVCDVGGRGTCVECTPAEPGACGGMRPVCGGELACRGCKAHGDCAASSACLPDGSCGSEANVAYVAPTGTDNDQCTKAAPCTKVAKALATMRPYVKLSGVTDEGVTVDNRTVTILAEPGAQLTRTSNGILLEVKGSSRLEIYDLEITGASGATGIGISLPAGNAATLGLHRAKVTGNQGGGISATGGTVAVSQSTISGNQGGGISAMNGTFDITNNFIYRNGNSAASTYGGLSLSPMGSSKLEFNTIVDNEANTGSASAGGVFCDLPGFVAANNLIFRNTGGPTANLQTFGVCTYANSFVRAGSSAVDNLPEFAHPNIQPFDYHLTTASPTTVRDAGGACTGLDIDGDPRPQGAACDLGADEYKP